MKRVYLSAPHVGERERELLLDAFDSNWLAPLGPHVDAFEREACARVGVGHAAAVSSGTAALHLALILLDVKPGDEVITADLTFVASANAVVYCGATPVFVDAHADTWTLDPGLLEEELLACRRRGRLPKAVVPVDLYGQCADYDAIGDICGRFGVPVVEDAAEALGATYQGRMAGSLADMAILSFNGNKIITTSGGGMLLSDRREWIERARFLSTQARDPAPHYQHSEVGYNYRLSNLLAAVGRGQLERLEERVDRRLSHSDAYREGLADLPGIDFMPVAPYGRWNGWLTCITVDPNAFGASSEDIRLALERHDIEARPVWKPMHCQPVFAGCRYRGSGVSERLFATGLCLPSGSSLGEADRNRIIDVVRSVCRG